MVRPPATPRLSAGSFPQTPAPAPRLSAGRGPLPDAPEANPVQPAASPLIPVTLIDAPTQRFWALAIYVGLWGWKIFDWLYVVENHEASLWLMIKWCIIDCVFIFLLPEMRIPWLELSAPAATMIYAGHFVSNFLMMFDIPIPFAGMLLAAGKAFFDKEMAISEHSVRVSNIIHNNSLIMGKQIINILPEGTAVLNRNNTPFCVGPGSQSVRLPIQFNGTMPVEIELLRIDLETGSQEKIKLSKREVNSIAKDIRNQMLDSTDATEGYYTIKKPGVYRLEKVLDEYKLEVQRITRDTYVVPCPKARFRRVEASERCIRDLSDLFLEVEGTPPLKIMYGRSVNGKDNGFHFQSLQPDGFSPLGSSSSGAVVSELDLTWIRPAKVTVPLNETFTTAGEWQYAINEVHDAFGNTVTYATHPDDLDPKPLPKHLLQRFMVNERPRASLRGCDLKNPLKTAKGTSTKLPVRMSLPGPTRDESAYAVSWQFTPVDKLTNSGDHGDEFELGHFDAKSSRETPQISRPGLYTLTGVESKYCKGEIEEPSSCMLLNPLEPQLSIRAEDISDKCAGNSVGLRVDLDLMGTPPFVVRYDVVTGSSTKHEFVNVQGLRHQMELKPTEAGKHKYIFKAIDDHVYKNQPLQGDDMVLEQYVRPAASAVIQHPTGNINTCLDDEVEVDVLLLGDGPFTLEWEIVHDGRKKPYKAVEITDSNYKIKTASLEKGGDYILALNSVQDKSGCRNFLKDEVKIHVRRQKPRAGFGLIESKRSVMVVEKTTFHLPLRLQGDGPWMISYVNRDVGATLEKQVTNANGYLPVKSRGTWEIVSVSDKQCRGTVDPAASIFEVGWEPRPEITIAASQGVTGEDRLFVKKEVCEGDIDGFEINLSGRAPFHVEYDIKQTHPSGSTSLQNKKLDVAQFKASIPLDTSKPGNYIYNFKSLADNLYDNDRGFSPLVLKQVVTAKPSALFVKPGQSFKYCVAEQEKEDTIPISLQGQAPFYVELELKHISGAMAETYTIPAIYSNKYSIQIPRQNLRLGTQQVRIRTVRDSRGCQQTYDVGGPSVQVHLYDAPSIYPMDTRTDYCVGERIAYTLSGTPPFEVSYAFAGSNRVAKSPTTNFRRVAESPGQFTIYGISDKGSECRAAVNITKTIHPLPSVRISRGKQVQVDIHEGSEVEIEFEFWGTPPFEFTYTRSSNARKGQQSTVLETRHDISEEPRKVVRASLEGTYEVVAIKDKYCAFSTQQPERKDSNKLLQF